MCTRIAELAYAPFKFIGDSIGAAIEDTRTDMKIHLVAITIFMGLLFTGLYTWMFSSVGLPLSTALATSFVVGFGASLVLMFMLTMSLRCLPDSTPKITTRYI